MTVPSAAPMRRGLVLLAIAASAWGSGGAVAEILYRTSGLGPIAVCWWRLVVGAAVLTVTRRKLPCVADWRAALPIGIGLAIAQAAYFAAITDVGVAVATMVTLGAGPLLVAIGARFALSERLSPVGVVAVLVALGGLVLLTRGAAGPRPAVGVGLALLAATGQAATTILSRRTSGRGADTTAACWIGAAVLTPLALVAGILPRHGVPVQTVGWLLYLGIVPTALAYRLFFAGLATVPATVASVITLLEPVAAAAIAVGLLGERLSGPVVVGAMVLLSAVTMISVTSGHPRK
ncbi:MAG TPA: DMT family transporter [Pseudonocardiaceae bacterium]